MEYTINLDVDTFYEIIFQKHFNEIISIPMNIGGIKIYQYNNIIDLVAKLLEDDTWDINGRLNCNERYYDFNPTLIMASFASIYISHF